MAGELVTFGLITYCQQDFVAEAVRGALAQDYQPLQIVISDDASPDGTFDIIEREVRGYAGPHRVLIHRNPERFGIRNFNSLMERAEGSFLVMAHGDDISLPERTRRLTSAWRQHGVSMVSSNAHVIDGKGQDQGLYLRPDDDKDVTLKRLIESGYLKPLRGSLLSWEPAVFARFSPLDPAKSAISSDWILPFRAGLLRGIHYIDEPLIRMRMHPQSASNRYLHDAKNPLVHMESNLANHVAQALYRLSDLNHAATTWDNPPANAPLLRGQLGLSLLRWASAWSQARNRLLASGLRARWTIPD